MTQTLTELRSLKVAFVYDWATTQYGGAEQVLLALHQLFPQAILYTSSYDPQRATWAHNFTVRSSFLQKIPFVRHSHLFMAPCLTFAFETFDLSEFDLIISVSSAAAKAVITRADQLHICYLLNPNRYLYEYSDHFLTSLPFHNWPILRSLLRRFSHYLVKLDQQASFRPDIMVAISRLVAERVKNYYGFTPQEILYPPLDLNMRQGLSYQKAKYHQKHLAAAENYFLLVSRLVAYKKIEVAIKACIHLQKKLVIVGRGPEEKALRRLARQLELQLGKQPEEFIVFKKNLHPRLLAKTYLSCQAVVMPGVEDFGLTALEANLFGKAIILNQQSGAAEVIQDGVTGIHIPYHTGESDQQLQKNLEASLEKFEQTRFNYQVLSKNAQEYGTTNFISNFATIITKYYQQKQQGKL